MCEIPQEEDVRYHLQNLIHLCENSGDVADEVEAIWKLLGLAGEYDDPLDRPRCGDMPGDYDEDEKDDS